MKAIQFKQFERAIAVCALAAHACAASPICVSNTNDAGGGSLRAAIIKANQAGGGDITFCVTNTIALLSPLPSLINITITGPGTNLLTISASNQCGIFAMTSGTTNTLSNLTIADGAVTVDYPGGGGGGGISNAGTLMLLNCVIRNCSVTGYPNCEGGGIYNAGDLLMSYCTVTNCELSPNSMTGSGGSGGGIANSGDLRMEYCTVSDCWGGIAAGGIYDEGTSMCLTSCIIDSCGCISDGGAAGVGGGIASYDGNARIQSCTISNCWAGTDGGGMEVGGMAVITNTSIVENGSFYGGGLFLGGTNIMVGCTIAGNESLTGGGIYNDGELTMLNCTVSGNSFCGGIQNAGAWWDNQGTNATIYADHCTVAFNTLNGYGEGCGVVNGGIFQAQDSIFAGNYDDYFGVLNSEGYNLIQNTNECTIEGNQTGNIYGRDPLLGPLQDNGGPTWTDALLPGSPAIDAGSSADTLAVDQRGIHRPQGLAPDIGAFEFQYATPVLVRMTFQSCTNCCLKLCGLSGGSYTLQASANLVNWSGVATNVADTNGVCAFTETGAAKGPCRFYRVSLPVPAGSVYIPAPSGIVAAPFVITNTYIWQTMLTGAINGGRAEYPFILPRAGEYVVEARVNAPNSGVNSIYVNIDAEPQDPAMIWDILPYTSASGFEERTVNWRGGGTDTADQFIPIVFTLSQGSHKLIIRGREANTLVQDMAISPYP